MITAKINAQNTMITEVSDHTGKTMDICPSRIESSCFSPRQLVQAALAGCLSMTIRGELSRNNIGYDDVTVMVDMEDTEGAEEKKTFTYSIDVKSSADPAVIEEIKKKAVNGCYIGGMLRTGILMKEGEMQEPDPSVKDRCCD